MPEIAEVRLMTDFLQQSLQGNQITDIELLHPEKIARYIQKSIKGLPQFNQWLSQGQHTVTKVDTRGKLAWMELTNQINEVYYIVIGFGMTGNIRPEPTPAYLEQYNRLQQSNITAEEFLKHAHLKINYLNRHTAEAQALYYHDIRRFGSWTFTPDQLYLFGHLEKLGHDPLRQAPIDDAEVIARFRTYNHQNICKVLMSQEVLAGVGNYCKSESLYTAKICPTVVVSAIPDSALVALYRAFRDLAQAAYRAGGASLYTYTGIDGDQSDFKNTLKVYSRETDPLGNAVIRIPEQQSADKRTTFWVPEIQSIGLVRLKLPPIKIRST